MSVSRLHASRYAALFLAFPAAAQERLSLGAPRAGSRLDLLQRLGGFIRAALAPELGVRGALILAGAALVYGILHALGPGHQKSLIAGTVLAEGGDLRGLAAAAGVAAVSHAAAVLAFGLVFLGLERLTGGSGASYTPAGERWRLLLTRLSAALLVLIAARLLFQRVCRALRRRSKAGKTEEAAACGCGHPHEGPCEEGRALGDRTLAMIAAGSLAPCPGAIIFLFTGIAAGNAAAGVAAVLAISAGMFLTLLGVGGIALYARRTSLRLTGGGRAAAARTLLSALEIGGSALILLFALALLF